jgi:probable rRNA maturation factor
MKIFISGHLRSICVISVLFSEDILMDQIEIDIQAEVQLDKAVKDLLRKTVSAVLNHEQITSPASLSILLADNDRLQELNRDFAGLDEPTDVLSFPVGEVDEMLASELADYLGDIAISVEKAERQAEKEGHPLPAELQLLTVHGVLHLLGYDHLEPAEKEVMWAAQQEILNALGVQVTIPAS